MVDLAEVIELVEGALKKLLMKEKDINTVICLHDLQGEFALILKVLATDEYAIL